ncbi:MAG: twin-arginine translocation signal domain-containing protein [Bacteroidota bacterium]|nr:twin-arginine translocation signal domain-containing protein [Bacteroidota bacterium]
MTKRDNFSRRDFIRTCALGTAALASGSLFGGSTLKAFAAPRTGPESVLFPLNQNWLFGGKFNSEALNPKFDDKDFSKVTLPHCVSRLSWQNWNPSAWEDIWTYRRHFVLPKECKGMRTFLNFEGVMVGTTPVINGHPLPQHLGGYLPSHYEITEWLNDQDNILAVEVDSRWSNVPPEGSPKGPKRIDYLEPGGIFRSAHLQAVPQIFISDVFAKPVNVLDSGRHVEVVCLIDGADVVTKSVELQVELKNKDLIISRARKTIRIEQTGTTEAALTLSNLGNIKLWDVDAPHLYEVEAKLFIGGKKIHDYHVRIGLRDARFELDGFFLNGRRLQLFGLNRHELFPYVGFAMPERVMRRDAEILKHEFNCNVVRCSHYPQNEAFFNACDELGLMAWEEVPGWGYLGDEAWKRLLVRDTREMVIRDRNHPSIIIWGVRANETPNDPVLYRTTKEIAKSLDDSRPTSGSMTGGSIKTWKEDWHQDVMAYDDYHTNKPGVVQLRKPVEGVPYMLAEVVGQFNYANPKEGFNSYYRRAGDVEFQKRQAIYHAQAHNEAAKDSRFCGVIAWCGFEYGSLVNQYHNIKYPGVADFFRVPKLGASFYQAQVNPRIKPVIIPNFYWDFGEKTPKGPGKNSSIFSNCERLELFIDGKEYKALHPDSVNYSHLKYPPFFVDLEIKEANNSELRIDGYIGDKMVLSKSFSSDLSQDRFFVEADDKELVGNGSDATRLEFKVTDKFGEARLFGKGIVAFTIKGPGEIVGDNPFNLDESGGVGAVWIKTLPNSSGEIVVEAVHEFLGTKSAAVKVSPENRWGKI